MRTSTHLAYRLDFTCVHISFGNECGDLEQSEMDGMQAAVEGVEGGADQWAKVSEKLGA